MDTIKKDSPVKKTKKPVSVDSKLHKWNKLSQEDIEVVNLYSDTEVASTHSKEGNTEAASTHSGECMVNLGDEYPELTTETLLQEFGNASVISPSEEYWKSISDKDADSGGKTLTELEEPSQQAFDTGEEVTRTEEQDTPIIKQDLGVVGNLIITSQEPRGERAVEKEKPIIKQDLGVVGNLIITSQEPRGERVENQELDVVEEVPGTTQELPIATPGEQEQELPEKELDVVEEVPVASQELPSATPGEQEQELPEKELDVVEEVPVASQELPSATPGEQEQELPEKELDVVEEVPVTSQELPIATSVEQKEELPEKELDVVGEVPVASNEVTSATLGEQDLPEQEGEAISPDYSNRKSIKKPQIISNATHITEAQVSSQADPTSHRSEKDSENIIGEDREYVKQTAGLSEDKPSEEVTAKETEFTKESHQHIRPERQASVHKTKQSTGAKPTNRDPVAPVASTSYNQPNSDPQKIVLELYPIEPDLILQLNWDKDNKLQIENIRMDTKLLELKKTQKLVGDKLKGLQESNKFKDQQTEEIRYFIQECRNKLQTFVDKRELNTTRPEEDVVVAAGDATEELVTCRVDLARQRVKIRGPAEDLKQLDALQLMGLLERFQCQELVLVTGTGPVQSRAGTMEGDGNVGLIPVWYLGHKGNILMVLAVLLLGNLISANLCVECGTTMRSLWTVLYFGSMAFHSGIILSMAYIRGYCLAPSIGPDLFHKVDNLILPKSYGVTLVLSFTSLISFLYLHGTQPCESWSVDVSIQVVALAANVLIQLVTCIYVIPSMVTIRQVTDSAEDEDTALLPDSFEENILTLRSLERHLPNISIATAVCMLINTSMTL